MSNKICSVEGCNNIVGRGGAKGFCPKHYYEHKKKTAPKCSIRGCEHKAITMGLCSTHYHRKQRYGDPLFAPTRPPKKQGRLKCKLEGCNGLYVAHGYCRKHYERFKKTGDPFTYSKRVSGEYTSRVRERYVYKGMLRRCYSKKDRNYFRYGATGIRVCERWLGPDGFHNFLEDMGPRPEGRYSLDRIDPKGDYAPDNCRWANDWIQANNKQNRDMRLRGVHFVKSRGTWRANITIHGKTITKNFKTVAEAQVQRQKWEAEYKIDI